MDSFTRDIDEELRSPQPPSTEAIIELYLMMDTEFMVGLFRSHSGYLGAAGYQGGRGLALISRDSFHPLYYKVKRAFDFAQERRKLAGFPPDPWPIEIERSHARRRLVWEPTSPEIKEAWRLFHRFVREGYHPYSVDRQGNPSTLVSVFDPHAGELVFDEGEVSNV